MKKILYTDDPETKQSLAAEGYAAARLVLVLALVASVLVCLAAVLVR